MENTEVEIFEVSLKLARMPNTKFLGCFISKEAHYLFINTYFTFLNKFLYMKLWN